MVIETFRRIPEYLSAVCLKADNMAEVAQWCGGAVSSDGRYVFVTPPARPSSDPAPKPTTRGTVGDWVVMDDLGDFYATPDAQLRKGWELDDVQPDP